MATHTPQHPPDGATRADVQLNVRSGAAARQLQVGATPRQGQAGFGVCAYATAFVFLGWSGLHQALLDRMSVAAYRVAALVVAMAGGVPLLILGLGQQGEYDSWSSFDVDSTGIDYDEAESRALQGFAMMVAGSTILGVVGFNIWCNLCADCFFLGTFVRDCNPAAATKATRRASIMLEVYGYWMPGVGLLGGHHFRLGNYGRGVLYLCTGGVCGLGWLADAALLPGLVDEYVTRHHLLDGLPGPDPARGGGHDGDARRNVRSGAIGCGLCGFCTVYLFLGWVGINQVMMDRLFAAAQRIASMVVMLCAGVPLLVIGTSIGESSCETETCYEERSRGDAMMISGATLMGVIGTNWLLNVVTDLFLLGLYTRDCDPERQTQATRRTSIRAEIWGLWYPGLGLLGAHHFRMGHTGRGVLYLCTGGVFVLGWLYDMFALHRQIDEYIDARGLVDGLPAAHEAHAKGNARRAVAAGGSKGGGSGPHVDKDISGGTVRAGAGPSATNARAADSRGRVGYHHDGRDDDEGVLDADRGAAVAIQIGSAARTGASAVGLVDANGAATVLDRSGAASSGVAMAAAGATHVTEGMEPGIELAAVAAGAVGGAAVAVAEAAASAVAPMLADLFKVAGRVYNMCLQAKVNRANCMLVGQRVSALRGPLGTVQRYVLALPAAEKASRTPALQHLQHALYDIEQLVAKQQVKGTVAGVLTASKFKREFEYLDRQVERCIATLTVGLDAESLSHTAELLKRSEVILSIDEKLDEMASAQAAMKTSLSDFASRVEENFEKIMAVQLQSRGGYGSGRSASGAGGGRGGDLSLPPYVLRWSSVKLGVEVGSGSFGVVWRGTLDDNEVAVKVLSAKSLTKRVMREMNQEAFVMSTLRHPNIIQFYGVVMERPHYALVTEFMAGGTLENLLQDDDIDLSWDARLRFARQVAVGVDHLHSREPPFGPIVHGDLKGANVLLDRDSTDARAVICDFGMSKVRSSSRGSTLGGGSGTLQWSAPEVLHAGGHPTTASDIFSLGMTLLEIAIRDHPWSDAHDAIVLAAVKEGRRPKVPDDVPGLYRTVIEMCWAQDPAERPSSNEVVARLRAIDGGA